MLPDFLLFMKNYTLCCIIFHKKHSLNFLFSTYLRQNLKKMEILLDFCTMKFYILSNYVQTEYKFFNMYMI